MEDMPGADLASCTCEAAPEPQTLNHIYAILSSILWDGPRSGEMSKDDLNSAIFMEAGTLP